MSQLFTPLKLRSVKLRNRIFVAPMCQYSCNDGTPDDWHLVHLGSRAVGAIQLGHAGRKASVQPHWLGGKGVALIEGGWQLLAPSALPFSPSSPEPRALSVEDLEQICSQFETAACRWTTQGRSPLAVAVRACPPLS